LVIISASYSRSPRFDSTSGDRQHDIFFVTVARGPCHSFPPRRSAFESRSGHVGFVVDKVSLGQVFSECFGFPCQFSFHRLLHTHHLSSGAGTIVQLVADVPSGLNHTPAKKLKKNYNGSGVLQNHDVSGSWFGPVIRCKGVKCSYAGSARAN
jgi:hypothetical protein